MKHKIRNFFPILVLTSVATFAIAQVVINKDRFNISGATQVQPTIQQVIGFDKADVYQFAPAETEANYKGWIAQQTEMKEGADWGHVITNASCPNGCIVIGNGPDPYADLPESDLEGGIGGAVAVPAGGGGGGSGGGGSGGGSPADNEKREQQRREYEQKVANLTSQLMSVNSRVDSLSAQARSVEVGLNQAVNAYNNAAHQRNFAAAESHKWLQSKTNSESEVKNFTKRIQEKSATLEQRKKDLQDLIDKTNNQSAAVNQTLEQKVKPGIQEVTNSATNVARKTVERANLHNASIQGIEQTARIDQKLVNTSTTPTDFAKSIEAAKADMTGVITSSDSPAYRDLSYAKSQIDRARARLDVSPLSEAQKHNMAAVLEIAEMLFSIADLHFAQGDISDGDLVLAQVGMALLPVFDALSDLTPGFSLAKDLITLSTGVNPVTFDTATDLQISLLAGSLFVPSIVKGSAGAIAKTAKLLMKFATTEGRQAAKAARILKAIEKADREIKPLMNMPDCLTLNKSFYFEMIFTLTSVAYACPGMLGDGVDKLLDSAKKLNVPASDLNRVVNQSHHVFGPQALARHKLEAVLESYSGDSLAAFKGIENAVQAKVDRGLVSGIYNTLEVSVNGFTITVKGNVIDGIAKVSTAFIP